LKVPEEIRTERLLLRPHRLGDLDAFAAFLAHPTATRYMSFPPEQKTREGAELMLETVIASYDSSEPIYSLTVADPTTDEYLGSCGANPDGDEIEIYYTIVPDHQGKGYATEAACALLECLRSTTSARIVAYVMPQNLVSVRVVTRLGFVDDGPVRRQPATAGIEHETLEGRRYVL